MRQCHACRAAPLASRRTDASRPPASIPRARRRRACLPSRAKRVQPRPARGRDAEPARGPSRRGLAAASGLEAGPRAGFQRVRPRGLEASRPRRLEASRQRRPRRLDAHTARDSDARVFDGPPGRRRGWTVSAHAARRVRRRTAFWAAPHAVKSMLQALEAESSMLRRLRRGGTQPPLEIETGLRLKCEGQTAAQALQLGAGGVQQLPAAAESRVSLQAEQVVLDARHGQ